MAPTAQQSPGVLVSVRDVKSCTLPESDDSERQSVVEEEPWIPRVSRRRAKGIYGFMLLIHFMLSVDMTSVAVALPTIARDMEASRTAVFSIGTVFSLSATIFQQPIAEISHVLGRKPAFLIVLVVFALGSIVAGTAKDMKMLLIGRAMQGFASGGSVLAAIVLTDLIELRDRATWISVQNGIQALGLVLGPLIGAGLLHASSWRWLFYVNLPAIAVSAAGLSLLLGFDKPQQGVMVCLSRVDWVGLGIFIPSSMAFLSPFTMAGVLYKWSSWKALVPLIFGILGLITLAVHQRHFASYPMFRASVFEKRVTVSALVGLTIFGTCVNMIFYYLVVFWSGVRGLNEILTGIALLPETFTMPIAAIICGLVMRKRNNIREAMLVSWPLTTISLGLLWFLDAKTPLAALIVINMGVGLGAGAASSALHITVLAATKREDNGHATAMSYLFRSAGMCLGIAVGTAIFTMGMNERFGQMEDSEMTAESILRMLKDVKKDPESRDAIVRTLRLLWMTCCALSGIAGLICCSCQYPGLYRTPKPVLGIPIHETKHDESDNNPDRDSGCCAKSWPSPSQQSPGQDPFAEEQKPAVSDFSSGADDFRDPRLKHSQQ